MLKPESVRKKRVFSGAQPSGILHLGNYLGALRQWINDQPLKESFFCVADLHAMRTWQNPQELRERTVDVTALYLAAGVDPDYSTIFIQSQVPAHAECCWILNCVTPLGWLERMTQFKSKKAQMDAISTSLLDYPVLMAADVLLYDTNEVPVGEDNKQHVELVRDIAIRFNNLYGETFILPEPVIPAVGARIRCFNQPEKKMSKSEAHIRGHAVLLTDSPDEIRWVIQHAVTDSGCEIIFSDDPDKAGVNNLLVIYELLTGQGRSEIETHFNGKGYVALKQEVAEVVVEALRPIRERYIALSSEKEEMFKILTQGAEKAIQVAGMKIEAVKNIVGFVPSFRSA